MRRNPNAEGLREIAQAFRLFNNASRTLDAMKLERDAERAEAWAVAASAYGVDAISRAAKALPLLSSSYRESWLGDPDTCMRLETLAKWLTIPAPQKLLAMDVRYDSPGGLGQYLVMFDEPGHSGDSRWVCQLESWATFAEKGA